MLKSQPNPWGKKFGHLKNRSLSIAVKMTAKRMFDEAVG
jgi:hypothetical protein